MTAMTFTGSTTTPGGDEDTWGVKNDADKDAIAADLQTLNTAAANSIKGNNTGSPANVKDLTVTQTTAMLNAVVGDTGSGGTKGLVPAPASGSAAKGHVLGAGGSFGSEIKAWGKFNASTAALIRGRNMTAVRNSDGNYTITLSPAMSSADYCVFATVVSSGSNSVYTYVEITSSSVFNIFTGSTKTTLVDGLSFMVQVVDTF